MTDLEKHIWGELPGHIRFGIILARYDELKELIHSLSDEEVERIKRVGRQLLEEQRNDDAVS